MIPVEALIRRIRPLSDMKRFPAGSDAIPTRKLLLSGPGGDNPATIASPPSPEKRALPLPATVVMIPLFALILRTPFFKLSTTRILPAESRVAPTGKIGTAVAAEPSPQNVEPPATVVM